ncbi:MULTISPECIES: hypothetical protein [Enterococcus]|uniref:hypothetical protein n=1 Tax=Enterococcus TaxID=1350 RepID=UPI002B4B982C|nr:MULTISPECIES: hypothetical protein [Enterococcus]
MKYEAKIAAETISGKKDSVDYMAMPAVAFTDLKLACGFTPTVSGNELRINYRTAGE